MTVHIWGAFGEVVEGGPAESRGYVAVRFQYDWERPGRYELPVDPETGNRTLCAWLTPDEVERGKVGGLFG